jgi:hypothetical protein
VSKCSSQKPLLTTGIRTRDLWFCSLDLRPLDQPAVINRLMMMMVLGEITPLVLAAEC